MKKRLLLVLTLCFVVSLSLFAQSETKSASENPTNSDHIGTWKLIKQRIVWEDGRVHIGDSSNVFQRKILTPTTFVVVIEVKMPNQGNKKLVRSVAGGHYTLVDGNYEELTEYASFRNFETMEVKYELTVDGNILHTTGKVDEKVYEETYIREE